jgi:hypothetical protein
MGEWRKSIDEGRVWLREHREAAVSMFLFTLLMFGQKLLYHDIGIDSETVFGYMDYNSIWCSTGRYGLVLSKKLFGFTNGVPFAAYSLMVVFLWAFVTYFGFLVWKWSRGNLSSTLFYVTAGAVFLSSPILTEQMYFTLQAPEIAWALLCCLVSADLASRLAFSPVYGWRQRPALFIRRLCLFGIPSVLFLIWAFGTYQAFAVVALMLFLISYLLHFLWSEGKKRIGSWFLGGACLAALYVAAFAGWWLIHKILCRFFFEEMTYTANMILWKVNPSACFNTLKQEFLQMFWGSTFFYQKLFVPALVLMAGLMVYVAWKKRRDQLPCFFFGLFLFLLSPMLLTLVTGGGFPMRSRIYYPLAAGSAFAFLVSFLAKAVQHESRHGHGLSRAQRPGDRERVTVVRKLLLFTAVCASVFGVWKQAGRSLRLQETAHLAFVGDCSLMNRIGARMEEVAGEELEQVPAVFVGKLAPDLPEDILRGEVTGHSFFDWDAGWYATGNHRIRGLAALIGIELSVGDDEQKKAAVEYSEKMPPWPAKGSVQKKDGVLIVKLSSPEKTSNRWWYSGGWHYWMNDFTYSLSSDWKEIDGSWYYFDENSRMVMGSREIDGKTYEFDWDGKWMEE